MLYNIGKITKVTKKFCWASHKFHHLPQCLYLVLASHKWLKNLTSASSPSVDSLLFHQFVSFNSSTFFTFIKAVYILTSTCVFLLLLYHCLKFNIKHVLISRVILKVCVQVLLFSRYMSNFGL